MRSDSCSSKQPGDYSERRPRYNSRCCTLRDASQARTQTHDSPRDYAGFDCIALDARIQLQMVSPQILECGYGMRARDACFFFCLRPMSL